MRCPQCSNKFTNTLLLDVIHYGEEESYIKCPTCKTQSATFEWGNLNFDNSSTQEEYIKILESSYHELKEKLEKKDELIKKQEEDLKNLKEYLLSGLKNEL